MIIFPAIDIQNGKAVRLKQGDKNHATIFHNNPLEAASIWQKQGAKWLHIVDLDGAFGGNCANADIIGAIAKHTGLPIQVGGGIRTLEATKNYLDAGATRLILGTVALEQPELFKKMCAAFPGKIGVSLDAENGILKSRGWLNATDKKITDLVPEIEAAGAAFIIFTDIERDGMHSGLNLNSLRSLLGRTGLPILAAGGVSTLADIQAVAKLKNSGNLQGVVCGRALYEKTLSLAEANAWLDSNC